MMPGHHANLPRAHWGEALISLSRLREREGPAAKRWEGEGLLSSSVSAAAWKKKEDPHPTLSRKRERAR
jgi:hypothetical protein